MKDAGKDPCERASKCISGLVREILWNTLFADDC